MMTPFPLKQLRDAWLNLALPLRHLVKSLSRWIPGTGSQGVTVITLDGQWLKLLQMQGEGQASARRITKVLACGVQGAGPEELHRLFQEARTTEGILAHEVLVANPTHLSTVRLFSLPSVDVREIRDIVELQAEKHTPYAKEEILTDFKVIERDRAGYSRVLLVIAHQDVIHRSVRLIEAAGFALDRVGCEMEGLINWFKVVTPGRAGAAASGTALVVEVDGSTTTLLLMSRGQPQFLRSLASGAEQLAEDPAQAGARLVTELQRSLEALESESGGPTKIQDVVVTGRIERLSELRGLIEAGLQVPVSLVSPWTGCEVAHGVREAAERLPDVSFASLVGLALAPSEVDLTPAATKLRHAFEERAKALVVLGCQFVTAMILISLLLMGRTHKQQRYYHQLRDLYQASAQEAAQIEEALRQIAFAKERLRQRGLLLEAVNTLAEFSTTEIVWESVTFTQEDGLILKGTSTELPKIYEFVAALDSTPLFGQVEVKRVAKRKFGDQDVTDFEISCPFFRPTAVP